MTEIHRKEDCPPSSCAYPESQNGIFFQGNKNPLPTSTVPSSSSAARSSPDTARMGSSTVALSRSSGIVSVSGHGKTAPPGWLRKGRPCIPGPVLPHPGGQTGRRRHSTYHRACAGIPGCPVSCLPGLARSCTDCSPHCYQWEVPKT